MFILDTNVISAARRIERSQILAHWLQAQSEADLYLSVVTIGEIALGIRKQEKINPVFAANLTAWLNLTLTQFGDRILEFSATDALIWGKLSADIGNSGADLLIAATALAHNATVVTANGSDFSPAGVKVLDPFTA